MNRRQSLDKTGILSPPGSFIAPSPQPSIPASPRLQPSPSQSPFSQDVLLVTNNTVVTQEPDHKTTIPHRRPSFHQVANSPNAGTVLFRPSPTQSPAGASTFITGATNELNTTLVGSNNIALNKKVGKKTPQPHGGHGHGMSTPASSPKAPKKAMSLTNSPITSPSPIASPTSNTALRPPTPQPLIQQIPVMSSGNQLLQIIQGPQLIAPQRQAHIISSAHAIAPQQHGHLGGQFIGQQQQQQQQQPAKNSKPQQILPKPATSSVLQMAGGKNTTSVAKGGVQMGQHAHQSQSPQMQTQIVQTQAQQQAPPHQVISAAGQTTATANATQGNIILPTGSLNTQPLLVNQMPVIVQQNTPQGVQFILRPSAPQITAPGLVIHNTRPQLPPPQPQQLLRIVNANGSMQLAAATPTFIVSSQANLIQQNLQGIKTNTAAPLTQIGGLQAQRQPQQIAAAINQHLIGQSVAQIQNLQLNGNLTHIQMPNGLNGQFISQLPSQFQQSLTGFNQLNQNISLNQISSTNLSQIAAAAAASQNMAAFQSPPPPQQNSDLVVSAQMQFTAQQQNTITVSQAQQLAQQQIPPIPISPIMSPQHPTIIQSVTPEPVRQTPTPGKLSNQGKIVQQGMDKIDSKHQSNHKIETPPTKSSSAATTKPKRPKKSKKKNSNNDSGSVSTGKLDLANVMKLCGIMDDDDLMDGEMEMPMISSEPMEVKEASSHDPPPGGEQSGVTSTSGDIMITIPFSGQNSDIPFSFTIPTSVESSETHQQQHQMKGATAVAKITPEIKGDHTAAGSGGPFMITIDSAEGALGQPYTISIPHIPSDSGDKSVLVSGSDGVSSAGISLPQTSMCVPTFVNTVLSSTVTPTLQSQINEIQNQLMGVATPTTTVTSSTTTSVTSTSTVASRATPTSSTGSISSSTTKKKSTKKSTKKADKSAKNLVGVVPGQIGNIQISQVDGSKNVTSKGVIDNQIQITPIVDTTKAGLQQQQQQQQQQILVTASQQVVGMPNIVTATAAPMQSVATPNVMNLQTNIVQPNVQINLPNSIQPQITPHPLVPQLTGALSLSLAEDGRLLLRHDANAPQDAQSQVILQTILSGALGNVTLITEPPNVDKQPPSQPVQQQQTNQIHPKIFANAPICSQKLHQVPHVISNHGKNVVMSGSQSGTHQFIPQTSVPQTASTGPHIVNTSMFGGTQSLQTAHTINTPSSMFQTPSTIPLTSQSVQQPISTASATLSTDSHTVQSVKVSKKHTIAHLPTSTATVSPQPMLVNPNLPKFVELPKIGPNQQLFSLNTITNQITQINPGLTTASLGPMERLLIVPAGINAQQLAQCLLQGQIHFNNIGQVNQAQHDRTETGAQNQNLPMNAPKPIVVGQPNAIVQTLPNTINHQNVVIQHPQSKDQHKVVKVNENKVKKASKAKKLKPASEAKVIKMPPNKNVVILDNRTLQKCNHFNETTTKNTTRMMVHPTTTASSIVATTSTMSCSTSTSVHVPNTAIVRPSIISNSARHHHSSTAHSHPIVSPSVVHQGQQVQQQHVQHVTPVQELPLHQPTMVHTKPPMQQINQTPSVTTTKSITTGTGQLPPLVSVNTTMPRVQTIQLTPQRQQMLKEVQLKIQTLSAKLQNKTLLSTLTIPMDFDASNSLLNQPLPTLTNLHAMTDADIHGALQRLFLEQQKILATGKIIPTIPTSHSFAGIPPSMPSPQIQVSVTLPKQSSPIDTNLPVPMKPDVGPIPIPGNSVVPVPAAPMANVQPMPSCKSAPGGSGNQQPSAVAETTTATQMSPKMKIPRQCLFERQLAVDQEGCTNPDTKTPFHSKEDAIKRLIRYHCTYGDFESEAEVQMEIETFEKAANQFQDQFNGMINKYQLLLMKESMNHVQTSELMMIDRLLVSDIQKEILDIQMNISNDLNTSSSAGNEHHEDAAIDNVTVKIEKKEPTTAAGQQNNPPSDVKHVVNSSASGSSNLHKNPSDTKKELEQFDIESEITPSFIMKKNESVNCKSTSEHSSVEDGYQFGLDYYNQHESKETGEDDSKQEPYDEWLCIQKELGYISESHKRHEMKMNELSPNHPSPMDPSKSVEKQLSEIFDEHSPKSVEHQLNDLFNPPTSCVKTDVIVASNSPLSEFFNADPIVGNAHADKYSDKSVETRLEAMFGEAPEDDKTDLVETRLEALFQGSSHEPATFHGANNLHPGMMSHKRQWNNNGEILMTPASGNESTESAIFSKNFVDTTMGNNNRWMPEYQNTQNLDHQTPNQQYDFISDTMDCVLSDDNHHHSGDGAEINKRLWNGDLMSGHTEPVPSKKMCFISKEILERDFLEMSVHPEMNLHQMNHTTFSSMNSMSLGSSSGSTGIPQGNNMATSNFDEDINRQVQNAIDSILNLQSSETDSFHFSLDQMGSFLADPPLSLPSAPSVTVNRPPSVAKRKQYPPHMNHINDCLLAGTDPAAHHIVIGSSPSGSSSSSSTATVVSDFNSVSTAHDSSALDDTVKSIITS